MLARLDLPDRETALREVHFPPEGTPFAQLQAPQPRPHRRLIFEELFFLELGLELKRRRMRERAGIAFATNDKVREAIREVLPFHPTTAQKRALGEIVADMRQPSPMRRLLQGDVGSGKTIVALQAMLVAMENGYQAALMAPTEILATQHFLAARKLLERSSRKPRIVLLTGSLDEDRKRHTRGLINRGEAQLSSARTR
jgi:ATP-dependent DNA helicase RecG